VISVSAVLPSNVPHPPAPPPSGAHPNASARERTAAPPHAEARSACARDGTRARGDVGVDAGATARAARLPSRGAIAAAAGVLAQVLALAWMGGAGVGTRTIVLAAALALAAAFAWERRARVRHADVVIATIAFGGLGMMAGDWIARAATHPATHQGAAMHHAPASSPLAWAMAAGVMLLTCAGACRWSCAPLRIGGWRRRTAAHLLSAAAMAGGMMAGDALLSLALAHALGATAGAHAAMVLGMAMGVAAALPLVPRIDARHPPRASAAPAEGEARIHLGTHPAG